MNVRSARRQHRAVSMAIRGWVMLHPIGDISINAATGVVTPTRLPRPFPHLLPELCPSPPPPDIFSAALFTITEPSCRIAELRSPSMNDRVFWGLRLNDRRPRPLKCYALGAGRSLEPPTTDERLATVSLVRRSSG